jgi:hypothetical protein
MAQLRSSARSRRRYVPFISVRLDYVRAEATIDIQPLRAELVQGTPLIDVFWGHLVSHVDGIYSRRGVPLSFSSTRPIFYALALIRNE